MIHLADLQLPNVTKIGIRFVFRTMSNVLGLAPTQNQFRERGNGPRPSRTIPANSPAWPVDQRPKKTKGRSRLQQAEIGILNAAAGLYHDWGKNSRKSSCLAKGRFWVQFQVLPATCRHLTECKVL